MSDHTIDLPCWETSDEGWELELGVCKLIVQRAFAGDDESTPHEVQWEVHWNDDWLSGRSPSQEQAKRAALAWAQKLLEQQAAVCAALLAPPDDV